MMNCGKAKKQLSDQLDQILAGVMPEELASHLHSCPKCAAELRALEKTRSALRLLAERRAPEYFTTQVMAQISRMSIPARALAWWQTRALRWGAIPAAGLAVLITWIGLQTLTPSPKIVKERNQHVYLQAYAQYQSQQALGGQTEMLAIAAEQDDAYGE